MLSIKIQKGNTSVCFDAPTDVLYDRHALWESTIFRISGTEEATVKIYTQDDEKLSDMIRNRLSDSDKISEVNELCRKVTYRCPADEKALIEQFENESSPLHFAPYHKFS